MFLATNTSASLQTTLAADAHLAEGQFLREQQTLNNAKSLIYRAWIIIIPEICEINCSVMPVVIEGVSKK
jgi:hypothetical protein